MYVIDGMISSIWMCEHCSCAHKLKMNKQWTIVFTTVYAYEPTSLRRIYQDRLADILGVELTLLEYKSQGHSQLD